MVLHNFFKQKLVPKHISIDFNHMVIDGSSIFGNKSIKSLFDIDNSLIINVYNAIFTHQNKPIFIFRPRSYVNIINCTIVDSDFSFIPELFVIASSQAKFLNLTIKNVFFDRSSLVTSFQSITEMNNIFVFSSIFHDCTLINNVDGTFLFNKFEINNCNGYSTIIFDSIGTVYFTANNFMSYNLSFTNNYSSPSYIFHSDFSLELYIENLTLKFNSNIGLFNGICKKLILNNCYILQSFYMNKYILQAAKSGIISLTNAHVRNCVCKSILSINNCISFSLVNATIINITNRMSLQNITNKSSSFFTLSKISSKIFINASKFLNIFNQNAPIFSIHGSYAFFSDTFFQNVQLNYLSCCIEADTTSNLFITKSYFPHSISGENNIKYFPIYAEGDFFVENKSLVSRKSRSSFDFHLIVLNDENKYWTLHLFIPLLAFQIVLIVLLFLKICKTNNDHRYNQYEYLLIS